MELLLPKRGVFENEYLTCVELFWAIGLLLPEVCILFLNFIIFVQKDNLSLRNNRSGK